LLARSIRFAQEVSSSVVRAASFHITSFLVSSSPHDFLCGINEMIA